MYACHAYALGSFDRCFGVGSMAFWGGSARIGCALPCSAFPVFWEPGRYGYSAYP